MINFEEFKDKKYGKLTIIDKMGRDFYPTSQVISLCECGEHFTCKISDIVNGLFTSCGCDRNEPLEHSTDLKGHRFEKLVAIKPLYRNKDRRLVWQCKCDCGAMCAIAGKLLVQGKTTSCGCKQRESLVSANLKHGLRHTRLYDEWYGIKRRCYEVTHGAYQRYGAIGITMCDEWKNDFMSFYNWAHANGYREDLTIDRIDNTKGYDPYNCRWATCKEQSNNRSYVKRFTYHGQTHTLSEWCDIFGVRYTGYIKGRYRSHPDWPLEQLLDLSPDITNELTFKEANNMAVTEYGNDAIVTMDAMTHMRAKAGMYGARVNDVQGNLLQIKEIVDNSFDEILDKTRVYPINITFFVNDNMTDYQVCITDRGRGIPVDKLVDSFTKANTSGKYSGTAYVASTGTFGVGSTVSVALAGKFIGITKRDDGFAYLEVAKGKIEDTYVTHKRIDADKSTIGTTVLLRPDTSLLTKSGIFMKAPDGFQRLVELLEFYDIFNNNVHVKVAIVKGMIGDDVIHQDHAKLWKFLNSGTFEGEKVVYESATAKSPRKYIQKKFGLRHTVWELGRIFKQVGGETDPYGYDIDIFVDQTCQSGYVGAVNNTPIDNPTSSHIETLQKCIKDKLLDYIDDENKLQYFETKYQVPISGHILAWFHGADFIGQDKTRFENGRFRDMYRSALRKVFNKISEAKWECLYEAIKENFEQEFAKYSKTAYKISKSLKGIGYTLNHIGSFYNCSSTDRTMTELFITEGDSAGGRVKAVRDDRYQAILKLRGKPFNAIRGDNKKLNQNLIYQDMVRLIGVTPNDKDLSNMNFNKIVIMTDADADGCHIVSLLIGTFYRINPLILEQGRVIITNPPLYSTLMKNQAIYLRDQDALEQSRINCVYRTLLDVYIETKQGEYTLNDDQFMSFCYLVKHIGRTVVKVANVLNIEPMILEQLIHCVDYLSVTNPDTNKIKQILGVDDVVYNKESDSIILVDSGIEVPVPLQRLQSEIRAYVLPEYERGVWKDFNMYVTTKYSDLYMHAPCTYMMLYSIFETLDTCYSIRRFKGLGEMSEQAIYYTCVDPQSRCFSVVRHVGDEKRIYDMLGADSSARKKLMDNNFIEE